MKQPKRLVPFSDQEMRIDWEKDLSFSLPYIDLRSQCPCAICVDEHTGKRLIFKENIPPSIRIKKINLTGRYAVQLEWNDGHSTGILHFDRLYELCKQYGKPILEAAPL